MGLPKICTRRRLFLGFQAVWLFDIKYSENISIDAVHFFFCLNITPLSWLEGMTEVNV